MFGETVTNETYHNGETWGDLVSSTQFKAFYDSPAAFRYPLPRTHKPEWDLGSTLHAMVLEPHREVITFPIESFSTKAGKEHWRLWLRGHGIDDTLVTYKADAVDAARKFAADNDYPVCTCEQYSRAAAMARSILHHVEAMEVLNGGQYERSFRTDKFKARPDCISGGLLADIKTTNNIDRFEYQIFDFRYESSMAFYDHVVRKCTDIEFGYWCFVAVESTPYRLDAEGLPVHKVKVFFLDRLLMDHASDQLSMALEDYEQCLKTDIWPDNLPGSKTISMRAYDL